MNDIDIMKDIDIIIDIMKDIDIIIIRSLPKTVMELFYQQRFIERGHADCPSYKAEWVARFESGYAWRLADSSSRAVLLSAMRTYGIEKKADILKALDD
jgi:hypothetical protein